MLLLALAPLQNAQAIDRSYLAQAARSRGCVFALSRLIAPGEYASEMICFKDEQLFDEKISSCTLRQIDVSIDQVVPVSGLHGADSKQNTLHVSRTCTRGGVAQILDVPVEDNVTGVDVISQSPAIMGKPELITGVGFKNELLRIKQRPLENRDFARSLTPENPPSLAADPGGPARETTSIEIFFATDRKYKIDQKPSQQFLEDRSDDGQLSLGLAKVSIPPNHTKGVLESPGLFPFLVGDPTATSVQLRSSQKISYENFYNGLSRKVKSSENKDLLVFVPGYNTTFEKSARRAAQLGFDIEFSGAIVVYSWPAGDELWKYPLAEANADWTYQHLADFLRDVALKSGSKNISLVGHSMGGRALTNAVSLLNQIKGQDKPKPFQKIILAAPDVDVASFRARSQSILDSTELLSLYASQNDKAIWASHKFHQNLRLGEGGRNIFSLPDMDSIDATKSNSSKLGHSYLEDSVAVINDVQVLLTANERASQRSHLVKRSSVNGIYWELLP